MGDTMQFETLFPRSGGESKNCDLCNARVGLLHYLVRSDDGISQALRGYCCRVCAVNLVEALARRQIAGLKKTLDGEALAAFEPKADFA